MIDFDLTLPESVCEPEMTYRINRELNLAWDIVENTGANLFLTGRAGTGKTTFLKSLREESVKRMVVLAPTGVAAINARGNTLHSFFQLPFAPFIPGKGFLTADKKYLNVSRQKRRLISSLSLLVIDEISMVRPDMLDAIDSILRHLRKSSLPFGGIQLLLIGDLRQLPPVVKESEWKHLAEHYPTPYFFESHALKKAGFQTVELSVVYRQSDSRFLDILNAIRDGKADQPILAALNERYKPDFSPADSDGYIRLTTHNHNAAAINDSRLASLQTPELTFEAEVEGDFPESAYPGDKILRLKRGAQVMFTKNDTGSARRFYNGLLGIVTDLSDEKIVVAPMGSEERIEVERAEWENTRYAVNDDTGAVVQQTVGTFRQYPLQLAWAITIHKSQGLTFDRAIIDASHSFAPGQTYVALSRCRNLDGLVLERIVPRSAIITDSDVNDFVSDCESNAPDASTIMSLKEAYTFSLLSELFDFEGLRRSYEDFYRGAMEYLVPLYPHIDTQLRACRDAFNKSLSEVSRKFLASYQGKAISAEIDAEDSDLVARIKKGCVYFLDILKDINDVLSDLPKDIDNQTYAERLNNAYDNLSYLMSLKSFILHAHSTVPFSRRAYLDAKARAVLSSDSRGFSKPRKERRQAPAGGRKPKGYSVFETLRMLQEGKSLVAIAAERGLKIGTIGAHLAQLIEMGKLKLEDIDDETIRTSAEFIRANLDKPAEEQRTLARTHLPIPDRLVNIIRRSLTDN